ncbi:MAG: C40 family peptidase, partial [Nanoarchaeota archaeon]|nr:C40 family peptidase [Nanoarchaeota archaeon]
LTQSYDYGIYQVSGNLDVQNAEIDNSAIGIQQNAGIVSVNQSSVHDNLSYGAYVSGLTIMNAQNNFWGDSTGPYHPILNPGGFGNPVSDNVLFIPWLQTDPTKEKPFVSNLNQFKSDGITAINERDITTEDIVVFKAMVSRQGGGDVKMQVEMKEFSQSFDGQGLIESDFVSSGSIAEITRYGLIAEQYHWRARAMDTNGAVSDWQEFGIPGNVDFEVVSIGQGAAGLAKQLANHPEAYLYGGKGWDYNLDEFLVPSSILSGYTYWNPYLESFDTGIGVDCSGLITWAFNRTINPFAYFTSNFVKYVNADGLHRDYQSDAVAESELLPGDAMFFDWDGDDYIDHTAMYIGGNGGFDVVNAKSQGFGIVTEVKDVYKQLGGFKDFRHIHEGIIEGEIVASSPVNLSVADPDGFTITPDSIIESDEEYIREIPDVLYYLEIEQADDGYPIDRVYFPVLKIGDYIIEVLPASIAQPTDTYTLDFSAGDQSITLADNVPISQIPSEGYGVTVNDDETISPFIPVAIDIKPGSDPNSVNCKNEKGVITVAILTTETFDATIVDADTVRFGPNEAEEIHKDKKTGKAKRHIEDADNDGDIDTVFHFRFEDTGIQCGDEEATLTGKTTDETDIRGTDSIRTIEGKNKQTIMSKLSGLLASLHVALTSLLELI